MYGKPNGDSQNQRGSGDSGLEISRNWGNCGGGNHKWRIRTTYFRNKREWQSLSVFMNRCARDCAQEEYLSGCRDLKLKYSMVQPSSTPQPEKSGMRREVGKWNCSWTMLRRVTRTGTRDADGKNHFLQSTWLHPDIKRALCCYCCSVVKSCLTLCHPMDCSTPGFPGFTISWSLLKSISIESMMLYLTISSSVTRFSTCLQSSSIRVFSNKSAICIWLPKYWNFSFSISPSNEYAGLISFH